MEYHEALFQDKFKPCNFWNYSVIRSINKSTQAEIVHSIFPSNYVINQTKHRINIKKRPK